MDFNTMNTIVALAICTTVLGIIMVPIILKHRFEIEKIRNQTEIRKEEIKARNRLDIEKLMIDEQNNNEKVYNTERTAIPKSTFEDDSMGYEIGAKRRRVSE